MLAYRASEQPLIDLLFHATLQWSSAATFLTIVCFFSFDITFIVNIEGIRIGTLSILKPIVTLSHVTISLKSFFVLY